MKFTDKRIPNIHPGEVLRVEFLEPLGVDVDQLSKATGITVARLNLLLAGSTTVDKEIASKLSHFFGNSTQFWIGLQDDFDRFDQ